MLDIEGMRRVTSAVMPHIAAGSDDAVLTAMHMARTSTDSLPLRLRAYSHRWLTERHLPSQLPDHLKASADRLYPTVKTAVGISIGFRAPELKPAGQSIARAMSEAVEDCYAQGREAPDYVRPRMNEAGARERRALFGHLTRIYASRSV